MLRKLLSRLHTWLAIGVLMLIGLAAVFAPMIAPYDPFQSLNNAYQAPSVQHWFGTDYLGRDVLSRWLWGSRFTLGVVVTGWLLTLTIGTVAAVGATVRKSVDRLITPVLDAWLTIPVVLVGLVTLTLIGRGFFALVAAVVAAQFAPFSRFCRNVLVNQTQLPHIIAARSLGAGEARIIVRHVLPGAAPVLAAYAGITFTYALFTATTLTFLGLGAQPATADWGVLLEEGRIAFRRAPWLSLPPGISIMLVVMAVNRLARSFQAMTG